MFNRTNPNRGERGDRAKRAKARRLQLRSLWAGDDDAGTRRSGGRRRRRRGGDGDGGSRGGPFRGRRPLRFLARTLGLDEEQFEAVTLLFSQLKTERAQASVDRRRTAALYAEALAADTFDTTKATEAAKIANEAQARFDGVLTGTLAQLHDLLDDKQRTRLASILRETPLEKS